ATGFSRAWLAEHDGHRRLVRLAHTPPQHPRRPDDNRGCPNGSRAHEHAPTDGEVADTDWTAAWISSISPWWGCSAECPVRCCVSRCLRTTSPTPTRRASSARTS